MALGHEVRREIVKQIGSNQFIGFKDIKNHLGVSTGTIYHHLDVLEDLIFQDDQRKYHLSPLGIHAYKMLQQNLDSIGGLKTEQQLLMDQKMKKLKQIGLLKPLFQFFIQDFRRAVLLAVGLILTAAVLSALFQVQAFLNLFLPFTPEMDTIFSLHFMIQFLSAVIGYLALIVMIELLTRLLFRKSENFRWLAVIISISYIPLIIYILLIGLLRALPFSLDTFIFVSRLLLVAFQVWATILLAFSISAVKYIKFERGLIIAIFIDYGIFMLLLLINSPIL